MTTSETRDCQNCGTPFVVDAQDFSFYQKIGVPPPTFCPDCRQQRRLAFFNLTTLYRRKCDLCGEMKISMYPPESPYTVYCPPCWWSDSWDPTEYGRDYDFNRPFFEQWNELFKEVPLLGLSLGLGAMDTSPHCNHAGDLKNCYLLFQAGYDEDCAYGFFVFGDRMIFDSSLAGASELCYDSRNIFKNNRVIGSYNTTETVNSAFLNDSNNCQDCFASANLYNKKYQIFNETYQKEEYYNELKKYDLGSYKTYQEIKERAHKHWEKFPPKPRWDEMSIDVTGNYVFESKNCKECYEVSGAENCKYLFQMIKGPVRDSYDLTSWGENQDLSYECSVVGFNVSDIKFSFEAGLDLQSVEYSKLSLSSSNHFGCVSVKKKNHCILNKQYPKKEYEELVHKIREHMNDMPYIDARGKVYRYGEFFPIELSPFPYNATLAQRFFPMKKESVEQSGWIWREPDVAQHTITKRADELPDHIKNANDDILKEIIACVECDRPFKIIPMELEFLRKMNLPLPRQCPFCRIEEKMNQWVNNMKLTTRTCTKCGDSVATPYTEEDAPDILCKQCYRNEYI